MSAPPVLFERRGRVALFTLSSFLCGLAPNLGLLIFFRVLQGIAGGGLAPSEQSMLVDTFPPAKRAAAFGLYSMAIVLAPALGPTLGGWITDNSSWRWIFFINVPVGFLSLFLTNRLHHGWHGAHSRRAGYCDYGAVHCAPHTDCRSETAHLLRVPLLSGGYVARESTQSEQTTDSSREPARCKDLG